MCVEYLVYLWNVVMQYGLFISPNISNAVYGFSFINLSVTMVFQFEAYNLWKTC